MDQDLNPAPAPEDKPEGNAALEALELKAAALDGAPEAAATEQTRAIALAAVDTNRVEIHAVLAMVRKAALPILAMRSPRKAAALAEIWTDERIESVAEEGAAVLALHGVKLDNLTGGFGPYVGLALALGPAAYATHLVIKAPEPQPAEVVDGQQQ